MRNIYVLLYVNIFVFSVVLFTSLCCYDYFAPVNVSVFHQRFDVSHPFHFFLISHQYTTYCCT